MGRLALTWPALAATAACTAVGFLVVPHLALTNIAMIYLLGVAATATFSNRAAAILASFLSVAAFDLFFVPPRGTFAVSDIEYVFTFAVMLAVALTISTLSHRLKVSATASLKANMRAEIEAMRSSLLSSVSHDLRTPLATIQGSAEALINRSALTESDQQLVVAIKEESTRMGTLVNNLLDMTRLQGKPKLNVDWHSLEEVIASAIARTQNLFEKSIITDIGDNLLIRIDGVLFEQAIVNLIENAATHAGGAAQVKISAQSDGRTISVSISDDGPGIKQADPSKIFDMFYGTPGKGMGLGLTISKSIVEAHGGTITAENNAQGAEFILRIPFAKQ
jgi:two-component system sensor histidine kinase KdpD